MKGFVGRDIGVAVVWNSVEVSLLAAPLGGLLAMVVAYIVERMRTVGTNLFNFVSLLPAILPHLLFGIGYIVAFNLPFGEKDLALTGTMKILVLNLLFGHIYLGASGRRPSGCMRRRAVTYCPAE